MKLQWKASPIKDLRQHYIGFPIEFRVGSFLKEVSDYVGGIQGCLPMKVVKFRPIEIIFPYIVESSFGDFVLLSIFNEEFLSFNHMICTVF